MASFCTSCGTPLVDGTARLCAKCGAAIPVHPESSVAMLPTATRLRKGKIIFLLMGGVLTLLVIQGFARGFIAGVFGGSDSRGSASQPVSHQSNITQAQTASSGGQSEPDSLADTDTQCGEGAKKCEGKAAGEWLTEWDEGHGTNYSCPVPEAAALLKIALLRGSKLDVANIYAYQYGSERAKELWGALVWNPPKYGEQPDGSYHLAGERQWATGNTDVLLELHPRGNRMEYFIRGRDSHTSTPLFANQGTCTRVADKTGVWALKP